MIRILGKIPLEIVVACSGGPDSMAVLDFLRQGRKSVHVVHVNHCTDFGSVSATLVSQYCLRWDIPFKIRKIDPVRPKGISLEEMWRNERYKILDEIGESLGLDVITCHHLDDQVETWVWSCLHGTPKTIPWRRGRVIRPFSLTEKVKLRSWCDRKNVPFIDDPSNQEVAFVRNRIRHKIVPEALLVNPGLKKTVMKRVIDNFKRSNGE
jgi:tRNA(Ile)-lysidine synthase